MPYLNIQTNVPVADAAALLGKASSLVADMLGKPESYVLVHLDADVPLIFAGSDAPAAYLQLKSLGLAQDKTAGYSLNLCALMAEILAIEASRVYIEFSAPERHMWGWNGATF